MKKNFLCILLLFINISVFSQQYSITAGNDVWGMNLFRHIDDARTFSFSNISPLTENLFALIDYSILTDRNIESRVDEASIMLSYPLHISNNFYVKPKAGLLISGNLAGDDIQNTYHNMLGIYSVEPPYDQEKISYHGLVDLGLGYNLNIQSFGYKNFLWNIHQQTKFISGYNFTADLSTGFIFKSLNTEYSLLYTYGFSQNIAEYNTLNYVNNIEDQQRINLTLNQGIMSYNLIMFPDGNYATGSFSLTFGGIHKKASFDKVDMKLSLGTETLQGVMPILSSLDIEMAPFTGPLSRVNFDLGVTYGWDTVNLSPGQDIKDEYYGGTHYNKFIGGININLLNQEKIWFINPFIGADMGVMYYHYFKLFASEEEDYDDYNTIPIYSLKGGVEILLPQFFEKDNVRYGLKASYIYRDTLNDLQLNEHFYINISLLIASDL